MLGEHDVLVPINMPEDSSNTCMRSETIQIGQIYHCLLKYCTIINVSFMIVFKTEVRMTIQGILQCTSLVCTFTQRFPSLVVILSLCWICCVGFTFRGQIYMSLDEIWPTPGHYRLDEEPFLSKRLYNPIPAFLKTGNQEAKKKDGFVFIDSLAHYCQHVSILRKVSQ